MKNSHAIFAKSIFHYVAIGGYLTSLALLPWSWFPPFPWLHDHAQWSDVFFAVAVCAWVVECARARVWPHWRPLHTALLAYGIWAGLSWLMSTSPNVNAMKWLGIMELIVMAVLTSELLQRANLFTPFAYVIAATSLAAAAAAILGLMLFYAGIKTRLIGTYGDLVASASYARAQAGTYQPNLLASYCIFAASVAAQALPATRWRRLFQAALWLTVLLTFARGILGFASASLIRHARRPLAIVFIVASVTILVALTLWNLTFDPSQPLAITFNSAPSSRWQALTSSWATLLVYPLFGSGTGTSPGIYRGLPFDAHCTPLNIAATMGLPALAAFGAIFVLLWRQHRQTPRSALNLALWSGLAGLTLDALTQDIEDFRHLWILIGALDAGSAKETT